MSSEQEIENEEDSAIPAGSPEIERLLFEIRGDRLGADVTQVLRIDRPGSKELLRSALSSEKASRALVFRSEGGEACLEVDVVLGVRAVRTRELRRMPKAAHVSEYSLGFWLDGERPVLLVDLPRTLAAKAPAAQQSKEANAPDAT